MAEVERSQSWRGRVPYRLLSVLISVLLVAAGVAIMYHRINWRDIAAVWRNLDPALVAAAIAIYWLQYPVNSFRLQRVIVWATGLSASATPSFWLLFRLTCSSGFVAVAAPVGLAGDAAKLVALRLFGGLSITDAARCTLFDRVVGVQCFAIIGLAVLPAQIVAGIPHGIVLVQLALFAGLIAAVGVLLIFPAALALVGHDFIDRIARVFAGYRSMITPGRLAIQLAIALLNVLIAWGTLYLLLRAAGLNTSSWIVAVFIPLLQLVNGLPFLYMGWGGRELAMAATLGVAGNLNANETLAISIAWGVVLIVTSAINGVFMLGDWRMRRSLGESNGVGRP